MYTAQEFKSNQEVKWCPGCGNHSILASVQRALPQICEELGLKKEQIVFVSGIGCSSRFPYYMNTYGFHSIHGRAAAVASGVKIANPDLCVWQISGDGDALAIGGNHLIHAIRRNVNINIILFNNQIYGLTKGQYSPTSKYGAITKTSPFGTVERPFIPGSLVIGTRGTFFARSLDVDIALTGECMLASAKHVGTGFTEILQNCVIYNDKAHAEITDKEVRADRTIVLRHGQKMIFGANRDKGLILDGFKIKAVKIGENGITEDDILVHDAHEPNFNLHLMLASMQSPELPVALGVIRDVDENSYELSVQQQVNEVKQTAKIHNVDELLHSGSTWEVK